MTFIGLRDKRSADDRARILHADLQTPLGSPVIQVMRSTAAPGDPDDR